MTDDRLMVAQAVLEGQISEDYLTHAEVDEMMILVAEAAFEKDMQSAVERGCAVFDGYEDGEDTIH
jgi:hypothetical protein